MKACFTCRGQSQLEDEEPEQSLENWMLKIDFYISLYSPPPCMLHLRTSTSKHLATQNSCHFPLQNGCPKGAWDLLFQGGNFTRMTYNLRNWGLYRASIILIVQDNFRENKSKCVCVCVCVCEFEPNIIKARWIRCGNKLKSPECILFYVRVCYIKKLAGQLHGGMEGLLNKWYLENG